MLLRRRALAITVFVGVGAIACSGEEDPAEPGATGGPGGGGGFGAESPHARSGGCRNETQDADETDVDCGGTSCPPCADGQSCKARSDCWSLLCASGTCTSDVGCADGSREGFTDAAVYLNIAACAGAFALPGLLAPPTREPACEHGAGNDGDASGAGCNVADLCQVGWHVCEGPDDVRLSSGEKGCAEIGATGFFVTRTSGGGGAACGDGANDLFGCGSAGEPPDAATCGPLDRFSHDLCSVLPPTWSCGGDGVNEANNVVNRGAEGGGALCCRG